MLKGLNNKLKGFNLLKDIFFYLNFDLLFINF
jgi:hypothetical protein